MKVKHFFIFLGISSMFFSCCRTKHCSDHSETSKYEGYATIKSISDAPADENNCENQAKKITFDFEPSTLSDRENYYYTTWSDADQSLTISDGKNPSQSWINKYHLSVGSKLKCTRIEVQGSCSTPVNFQFSEIDKYCGCE